MKVCLPLFQAVTTLQLVSGSISLGHQDCVSLIYLYLRALNSASMERSWLHNSLVSFHSTCSRHHVLPTCLHLPLLKRVINRHPTPISYQHTVPLRHSTSNIQVPYSTLNEWYLPTTLILTQFLPVNPTQSIVPSFFLTSSTILTLYVPTPAPPTNYR